MNCERKDDVDRIEPPVAAWPAQTDVAGRESGGLRSRLWTPRLLILFSLLLGISACGQVPANTSSAKPGYAEPMVGTDLKRVVLTEKASKRLDIQTTPVREEKVARKRKVGGRVEAFPAPSATPASTANAGGVLVRVRLTESDLARVDRTRPALVLPLDDGSTGGVLARTVAAPAGRGDADDQDGGLYYELAGDHGFVAGQAVFVEQYLLDGETLRKIIPFGAVLYGLDGETWAYTNPEALHFVRQPIKIDYFDGGLVGLSEGPPAGAAVVTVGGAQLYGIETGVSK